MKLPSLRQLLQGLIACTLVVGGGGVALTVGQTTHEQSIHSCAPLPLQAENPLRFAAPLLPQNTLPSPHSAKLASHEEPLTDRNEAPAVVPSSPVQLRAPVVQYAAPRPKPADEGSPEVLLTQGRRIEPLPEPRGPEVLPPPGGIVEPYIIVEEEFIPRGNRGFEFGQMLPPIYDEQPLEYVGPKPIPTDVYSHAVNALDAECARIRCDVPTLGKERVAFALFSIDAARPQNAVSTRFDFASGINRPDRAEYIWSQIGSGGPPSPETNLDYLEMRVHSETMIGNSSGFFEIPLRFLNPEVNNNTTGFANLTFGTKSVLIEKDGMFGLATPGNAYDRFQVSSLFKTHISLGSPLTGRGLTNGSIALEPGMLANYEVSPRTFLHGEMSYWIPIGGSAFAGNFFRCGMGVSHVLHSSLLAACPGKAFAIIPTFEVVGTRFTTGLQTLPDGSTVDASNSPIVNLEPGVRIVVGNHMEVGGSFARNITNDHLYKNLGRFEVRWFW